MIARAGGICQVEPTEAEALRRMLAGQSSEGTADEAGGGVEAAAEARMGYRPIHRQLRIGPQVRLLTSP